MERELEGECERSERLVLRWESLVAMSDHFPFKCCVWGIELSRDSRRWRVEELMCSFSDTFMAMLRKWRELCYGGGVISDVCV